MTEAEPAPFRLRGKRFLLTWAQADGEFTAIRDFLSDFAAFKRLRIGRERHADGNHHIHAYVEFTRSLDRTLRAQWNLNGRRPDIRAKRTKREIQNAENYPAKDGDFEDFGAPFVEEDEDAPLDIVQKARECQDYGEFINWCHANKVQHGWGKDAWNQTKAQVETVDDDSHTPLDDDSAVHRYLRELQFDENDGRSIVLVGPAGCGKTTWARRNTPPPCLFVSDVDDLKSFREGYHRSIIFDDMHFNGDADGKFAMSRTKQIHLVDRAFTRSIRIRYFNARIPAGVFKVFTGNHFMFMRDPAIARRVLEINLY